MSQAATPWMSSRTLFLITLYGIASEDRSFFREPSLTELTGEMMPPPKLAVNSVDPYPHDHRSFMLIHVPLTTGRQATDTLSPCRRARNGRHAG